MSFGLVVPIILLALTWSESVRGQSSPQESFMVQYFERRMTHLEVGDTSGYCTQLLQVTFSFRRIPVK
jgi:hypothetical protein